MDEMVMIGIGIGLLAVVFAVSVVIVMIKATRRSMRSEPPPDQPVVDRATLYNSLLSLNRSEHPFVVRIAADADLKIEWDVVEARWIEVLGSGAENVKYQAWLVLNEQRRTVEYYETLLQTKLTAGGPSVTFGSHTTRGLALSGRRRQHRWGIGRDFRVSEVVNYDFSPDDVKDLVRQVANDAGWTFQLRLTKPKRVESSAARAESSRPATAP